MAANAAYLQYMGRVSMAANSSRASCVRCRRLRYARAWRRDEEAKKGRGRETTSLKRRGRERGRRSGARMGGGGEGGGAWGPSSKTAYCSKRMLRRSPLLMRTMQSFSWNRPSCSALPPCSRRLTNSPRVLEQPQHRGRGGRKGYNVLSHCLHFL